MIRLTDKNVNYTHTEDTMSNVFANFNGFKYELNSGAVATRLNELKKIEDIMEKYGITSPKELEQKLDRDIPIKVEWAEPPIIGRICPTCKHTSYYCSNSRNDEYTKQPDNYCCKCGQRFIKEKWEI